MPMARMHGSEMSRRWARWGRALSQGSMAGLLVLGFVFSVYQVWRTCGAQATDRKVTLDFLWPTYTPQKVRYGEYLVERYMEEHPEVHVNLILSPDPYRKLQVMIAGRTTPDVAWMGIGWMQFADAFMKLDERVAADDHVEPTDYFPGLWEAVKWKGVVQALPSSGQVGVIYYNKDLFDEAGLPYPSDDWSWDDLARMAKALTKDFDGDGVIDQYGVQLGQVYVVPFMLYDGQIADEAWQEARVNTPVTRALLERYEDLIYGSRVMPTPAASQELGMLPMFEAGRVAMHAASAYAIESFRKVQFDWDVAPFPCFEFEGKRYRATGLWQEEFAILWDTDVPEEAWDFARFCSGKEMIRWATLHGHIVPGRRDVAGSEAYLHSGKRPENMQAFVDSQAFAVPIYPHPWVKRIGIELEPAFSRFLAGVEGKRCSAGEALEKMDRALQKLLDEYNEEHPAGNPGG